jgi:hypothetical protein
MQDRLFSINYAGTVIVTAKQWQLASNIKSNAVTAK